jgi:integrase
MKQRRSANMKGATKKEGSSWYYVVMLGYKANGKPNQKKKRGFRTQKEAKMALNKVIYEYQTGIYVEPSTMLYADLLKQWLEQKKRSVQTSTYIAYELYVKKHIIPALGHYQLSKIKPLNLIDFQKKLYEEANLSGTSVQKIHTTVKDSLTFACKMELIAKNPADSIERPKRDDKEIEVWDIDEVKRFLEFSKDDPFFIVYHLALTTGMRQSEILGIRWKDIAIENKKITIKQVMCNFEKKPKPGAKSKAGKRMILFGDETIEALLKHKRNQEKDKAIAGDLYKDQDLVACTSIGTRINPSNLRRSFYRQVKNAELKKIRFHDLRHTHATLCLSLNLHPKIVSERLGHSNVKITLDTYSHVLPNLQNEAVNEISRAIFK